MLDKIYTANVVEICDNGDAILELPPELCEDMGWKVGDTLDISLDNGEVILKKIENQTI